MSQDFDFDILPSRFHVPYFCIILLSDIFVGYCGEDVTVNISKTSIKVTLTKTGVLICDHDMTNISFASAGEKVGGTISFGSGINIPICK